MSNDFDDAKKGLRRIADAFKKFAEQHLDDDVTMRAVRSAAAGGKAAINKARQEFPKPWIAQTAEAFYDTLKGEEVAEGISSTIRSFDEEKVKNILDGFLNKMKEDENALKFARSLKQIVDKTSDDQIENAFEELAFGRDPKQQMMLHMLLGALKPRIEDIRQSSEEDVAQMIKNLADTIPTEAIAIQVGALTRQATPENVQDKTEEAVHNLPRPETISDTLHDVAEAASKGLQDISRAQKLSDVRSIVDTFKDEAAQIIEERIANDNNSKPPFKRKDRDSGNDFTL